MKRISILIIAIVSLALSAKAQSVSYGGKLGLSFPGFQDERIASQRITPTISFTGAFNLNKNFLFQTEVGFERKGNKFTNNAWDNLGVIIEDSTYEVKTNMDYITIPLFVKFNLGRSNKFYFQAGGYYGYLLGAKFSGVKFGEVVEKESIINGFSLHDYGVIIGGGLETPISREMSLLLDVKYNYGLKDLNIDPAIIGHSDPILNKSFVMSMGLVILID